MDSSCEANSFVIDIRRIHIFGLLVERLSHGIPGPLDKYSTQLFIGNIPVDLHSKLTHV
jgi:hypothetical protein